MVQSNRVFDPTVENQMLDQIINGTHNGVASDRAMMEIKPILDHYGLTSELRKVLRRALLMGAVEATRESRSMNEEYIRRKLKKLSKSGRLLPAEKVGIVTKEQRQENSAKFLARYIPELSESK